jgi:alpha-aminoadipate carrier protein LysW
VNGLKAACPVCKLEVELPDDVIEGEIVEHECGVVLEVVKVNGELKLKVLEGVEEDWGE